MKRFLKCTKIYNIISLANERLCVEVSKMKLAKFCIQVQLHYYVKNIFISIQDIAILSFPDAMMDFGSQQLISCYVQECLKATEPSGQSCSTY